MQLAVCRPCELGPAELRRWRQIQRQDPELTSPFLSPEFARAVDGVRGDVRVAVLEEGAGFFAFQQRRRLGFPLARGVSDYQALIAPRELEIDKSSLLAATGLAVWEFDHLVGRQAPFFDPRARLRPSWIVDVSDGYPAYLADREKAAPKTMSSMRRKRKKLYREHEVRFVPDDRDPAVLAILRAWKSEQYRRTGRRDRFSWPWVVELVDVLFQLRDQGCQGSLASLWAGDRLIAAHFGLRSEDVLACWFPAYRREDGRYSPGFELFMRLAEDAGDQRSRLDLGKGDEPFKQVLANKHALVAEGQAARPSPAAWAHRARRAPYTHLEAQVLARPAARRAARQVLAAVGRIRQGR